MINRHLKRIELVRAIVLFAIVADATASVASWGLSAATRGEIAERDARELERRSEVQWGGGDDDYEEDLYLGQHDPDNHLDVDTCKVTVDTSCGTHACVALYADGSASVWGKPSYGGDITETDNGRVVDLSGTTTKVAAISCGGYACVALYADGSATVWGKSSRGGDITETDNGRVVDLSGTTTKVAAISCGGSWTRVCVALYADGSATTWGDSTRGGDITTVNLSGTTTKVAAISCGGFACVALYADGSATAWGDSNKGGDITKTYNGVNGVNNGRVVDLSGTTTKVTAISCGDKACAALFADGSASVWGYQYAGGDITETDNGRVVDLSGTTTKVTAISCGGQACVALYADGSATAWGQSNGGGDITKTENGRVVDLSGTTTKVTAISCGGAACAALYADGSATTWGGFPSRGGDLTETDNGRVVDLSGTTTKVAAISCGGRACVALYADGSATVWGSDDRGGDLTRSNFYPYLQEGGRFEPGVDYLASGVADISCGESACVARFCNLFSWCPNVADEPSNQYVSGNTCAACPAGNYNDAGNVISDGSTTCKAPTASWMDLGWRSADCVNPDSSTVGGESDIVIDERSGGNGEPTCYKVKTFAESEDLCYRAGGRLCTSDEIERGATTGTGCRFDFEHVWTSTTCGSGGGKHVTKLGKGGGKCGKGNLDSKEQCSDDSYQAKGVRCCAGYAVNMPTTTSKINAGDTTVEMDDVSGIKVGDELNLSNGNTKETKTVVDISTTRRRRRGVEPQPGIVTFTPATINTFPAGSTVAVSGPPLFEWQQERGCCRGKVGESTYNHHATVSDVQVFSQSARDEADLNCTATCASDTTCTAIELTVKKGTARCEFHTSAINAATRGSKSCKKAQCKYKTAYMVPTAAPVAGPTPMVSPTSAPTAVPTPAPAWTEKKGCCRQVDGKIKYSHQDTATTTIISATVFSAATVECQVQCNADANCTAAE
eukprot:gene17039-19265_t